jgi:hypothetical protein
MEPAATNDIKSKHLRGNKESLRGGDETLEFLERIEAVSLTIAAKNREMADLRPRAEFKLYLLDRQQEIGIKDIVKA